MQGRGVRVHGGQAPSDALDFSAPRNPLGIPTFIQELLSSVLSADLFTRYPDPNYRRFREVIAEFYGIEPGYVVPLNGSAEAIQLLLPIVKPRALLVFEPTFGDHRIAAHALGVAYVPIPLRVKGTFFTVDTELYSEIVKSIGEGFVALLSNPNNPTGALAGLSIVEELLEHTPRGSYLIVDEAFIELSPRGRSVLELCDDRLIVLRSFTKSLAVPGLRIGFLYSCNRSVVELVDSLRQPWNLNSLAELVIKEVLGKLVDEYRKYLEKARRIIAEELEFLIPALRALGLLAFDSQAPFILLKHAIPHPEFGRRLALRKIYVRNASSFLYLDQHYSRISILGRDLDKMLLEVLAWCVEEDLR